MHIIIINQKVYIKIFRRKQTRVNGLIIRYVAVIVIVNGKSIILAHVLQVKIYSPLILASLMQC